MVSVTAPRLASPPVQDTTSRFVAYMAARPAPLDPVERLLCRLDWLLTRAAR